VKATEPAIVALRLRERFGELDQRLVSSQADELYDASAPLLELSANFADDVYTEPVREVRGKTCAFSDRAAFVACSCPDIALESGLLIGACMAGHLGHRSLDCPKKVTFEKILEMTECLCKEYNLPRSGARASFALATRYLSLFDGPAPSTKKLIKDAENWLDSQLSSRPKGMVWLPCATVYLGREAAQTISDIWLRREIQIRHCDQESMRSCIKNV